MNKVFIFTYRNDAKKAILSAKAAKASLNADVYLVDDEANNMLIADYETAKSEGINYIASSFVRRGNLNGKECVQGILQTMIDNSQEGDILIKVDSDTIILKSNWLEPMQSDNVCAVGSKSDHHAMFGMCYAIKRDDAAEALNRLPAVNLTNTAEDLALNELLLTLNKEIVLHPAWTQANGGTFTAYNWGLNPNMRYKYVELFDVITFGNLMPMNMPDSTIIEVMSYFSNQAQTINQ